VYLVSSSVVTHKIPAVHVLVCHLNSPALSVQISLQNWFPGDHWSVLSCTGFLSPQCLSAVCIKNPILIAGGKEAFLLFPPKFEYLGFLHLYLTVRMISTNFPPKLVSLETRPASVVSGAGFPSQYKEVAAYLMYFPFLCQVSCGYHSRPLHQVCARDNKVYGITTKKRKWHQLKLVLSIPTLAKARPQTLHSGISSIISNA